MKCQDCEERFSARHEGELSDADVARFERHVAACARCRTGWEAFRYALADLQALEPRATSGAEVAAILAAVDAATATEVARPRSTARRALLTHLVAAGVGALVVWLLWPGPEEPAPRVVEREVRIEVPVETRVEVPVEKLVEVETRVEVPVEVRVEVPVERRVVVAHPLQADADALLALAETWSRALDRATEVRGAELAALAADEPEPARDVDAPVASRPRDRGAPVRVVRSGDRVSLVTRGSVTDVVPALIAMLSSDDPLLRKAVEGRLETIRGAGGAPAVAAAEPETPGLRDRVQALFRGPADDAAPATTDPTEAWRAWWETHGDELAALEPRATY